MTEASNSPNPQENQTIEVDLSGSEYNDLQKICEQHHLSVSDAVRQGLSLLEIADPNHYDVIRRPKDRTLPDERITAHLSITDETAK